MIQVTLEASVTSSSTHQAPYTCVFSSTDTCITFENAIVENIYAVDGNYTATTIAHFLDEACFTNAVITAKFTDANGCSNSKAVTVANPCTTLNTTVSNNGEFVFIADTSGGTPGYTYEWIYDTGIFNTVPDSDPTDNILSLNFIGTVQPASTIISVVTTDNNNCQTIVNYTYRFCRPTWNVRDNTTISLNCDNTPLVGCSFTPISQRRNYSLANILTLCSDQEVDWTTLEVNSSTNICVVNNQDGTISIASNSTGLSTLIQLNVKTKSGIKSFTLYLTISSPACLTNMPINVVNETTQINATNSVGTPIIIETSKRIAGDPDYSTMAITTAPTFGTASINPNADIVYTPTDLTTTTGIPDIIKWSIQSTTGKTVFATETILRDAIASPVTVGDTVCVTCGESTSATDILANDTGDVVRDTVYLTSQDVDISVTIDSDNNMIFTATPGASFTNLVKYKVKNSQGVDSNEGTIVVSAACTGTPQSPLNITCFSSKAFDLIDYFTGTNAFNTTFTEDGSTASPDYITQGGTITGANGAVDFTGINAGTYRFKFVADNIVACAGTDDEDYITIINNAAPALTITGTTLVSTGLYKIDFSYASMIETFNVTDAGSPATFQTTISFGSGTGTFNIYSTAANTIAISGTSQCGTIINDTAVLP